MLDVHRGNWFLENDSFKRPYLVASLYCCVSVLISITMHITSFGSFGQAVLEEKIFLNLYRDNGILNTDIYI
jgi:hypothetical protein